MSEQFDTVIGDVWETHITDNGTVFATRNALYRCREHDCVQIIPDYTITRTFLVNGSVLISAPGHGVAQLRGDNPEIVIPEEAYSRGLIFTLIESDSLVTDSMTLGAGLYLFKRNGDVFYYEYASAQAYAAEVFLGKPVTIPPESYKISKLRNRDLAFATISSGIHVLDSKLQPRYQIDRQSGLRVDMVLNTFEDRDGSLWGLLNNGISRIDNPGYVRFWNEDSGISGTVLSIGTFKEDIVVSTSSGVYLIEHDERNVRLNRINTLTSQMWQSREVRVGNRDYLLIAGNNYLSYWDGDRYRILKQTASRSLYQSKTVPGRIYVGYLRGWGYLDLVQDANGLLRVAKDVTFSDPPFEIREIFEDNDGMIWLLARFHGIFRTNFPQNPEAELEVDAFTYEWANVAEETILMGMNIVGDSLVFTGPTGIVGLNTNERHFLSENPMFTSQLQGRTIMSIVNINDDQILVLLHQGYAKLERGDDGVWEVIQESGRDTPDAPMYGVTITEQYIWTGGAEGLFKYDRSLRLLVSLS